MNKERITNIIGILLFYSIIVFGVIGLNYKLGQQKSATEPVTHIAQGYQR